MVFSDTFPFDTGGVHNLLGFILNWNYELKNTFFCAQCQQMFPLPDEISATSIQQSMFSTKSENFRYLICVIIALSISLSEVVTDVRYRDFSQYISEEVIECGLTLEDDKDWVLSKNQRINQIRDMFQNNMTVWKVERIFEFYSKL